ncbi:hypothetical protein EIP86_004826 [Pleurotus ostreatoroseus]|nr:hypothetical protein EIP86_004826 [Pleurotus ostreatoroseus]
MTTSTAATSSQNGDSRDVPPVRRRHNPVDEVIITEKLEVIRLRDTEHKMVNQYEFEKCLGKGQHGQVWVATNTLTQQAVAIKMLKRKDKKAEKMSALRRRNLPSSPHVPLVDRLSTTEMKILKEIAIMKKLRHPNVVRLLEVMDDHLLKDIYLVMEYCGGGEIKWRTKNNEPILRVGQTRRIVRDVIVGLEYLHYQGIIHRDIKPANLFWSEDRRIVKIGDFGVSHFSMAQRIAAAGEQARESEEDPILMDESDLSKFAGTPMFLAPEILVDTFSDASTLTTSTVTATENPDESGNSTPRRRPTITKAIDVWALGVTIYCLLFGRLPFNGESEFAIYRSIKEDDWSIPETMGVDRIPTGGRYQAKQKRGRETEGYLLVSLLEGLLQKDPKNRLTLGETKKQPWILKDMSHPDVWLRKTQIRNSLTVTDTEANSALSFVRFKWTVDWARQVSNFIRGVRAQRSSRQIGKPAERSRGKGKGRERDDVGTRSMPSVSLSRQRSIAIGVHEREKQKQYNSMRGVANRSVQDVSGSSWRHSSHHPSHQPKKSEPVPSGSGLRVEGSGAKPRRGSAPSHGSPKLSVPAIPPASRVASPRPVLAHQSSRSPQPMTPIITTPSTSGTPSALTPSPIPSDLEERGRNRFSLSASSIYRWVTGRSGAPSPQEPGTPTLSSGATSPRTAPSAIQEYRRTSITRELALRRSEDALNHVSSRKSSSSSGPLTLAMRAASWGEVGTGYRRSEDMHSLHSGERNEETLDYDTRFIGVGGYAQSPVPSVPSGVLSTVSSTASLGQPAFNAAQALLQRGVDGPPAVDVAARPRSHATSPLARSPRSGYSRSRSQLSRSSYDEDDDRSSLSGEETPSEADFTGVQSHTSQMYHDDDDDESDIEDMPLEVRTRRPSVSVAGVSTSPPRRSDSQSRGRTIRPTICT